jgi:hypothetical protein
MEEWEIATALRGARAHRAHDAIPSVLRPWLLDAEWDPERLRSVGRPITALPVAALRWCYALPWWQNNGTPFAVTPRAVIEHPGSYPDHDAHVAVADVSRPLHVIRRHGRWVVLDGLHRLVRAELDGHERVRVVPLGREQLTRVVARAEPYAVTSSTSCARESIRS